MGTHVVPASLQQTGLARGVAERQTDTLSPSLLNALCLASLFLCKPRRSLQPGLGHAHVRVHRGSPLRLLPFCPKSCNLAGVACD